MMIFFKNQEKLQFYSKTGNRTNFVREIFCIRAGNSPHNMLIPNMHFLKTRTKNRIPGHENGHKPSPDDDEF